MSVQLGRSDVTNAYNRVTSSIPTTDEPAIQAAIQQVLGAFEELERHIAMFCAEESIDKAREVIHRNEVMLAKLRAQQMSGDVNPTCTCPEWGNPSWPHRGGCPVLRSAGAGPEES